MKDPTNRGSLGFRVIGAMKLVTALGLAAAGLGIFRLLNSDLGAFLEHWAARLHLDPDARLLRSVIQQVSGLDRAHRLVIIAGTWFYALLEFAEGIGLLLKRHWAEYLTIVATAVLLPPEILEIVQKRDAVRISVLIANLAILVYLIVKVVQQTRLRRASRGQEPAS